MPYNIIFHHAEKRAVEFLRVIKDLAPINAKEIVMGKEVKLPYVFMGTFISTLFRIEYLGGKFDGKHCKVDKKKCIHCGKCYLDRPMENCTLQDGYPAFGKKCLMRQRCSMYCPKDAIKTGWFHRWKVHGPSFFKEPMNEEVDTCKNYCKKAYKRYFKETEKVAENAK